MTKKRRRVNYRMGGKDGNRKREDARKQRENDRKKKDNVKKKKARTDGVVKMKSVNKKNKDDEMKAKGVNKKEDMLADKDGDGQKKTANPKTVKKL